MIFLVIVRRCRCEKCGGIFDLDPAEPIPANCRLCNSAVWQWGRQDRAMSSVRHGQVVPKVLNKGAKSLRFKEHGKRQYTDFLSKEDYEAKKKAVEEQAAKGDD